MRDPDKIRSGPICDTIAIITLDQKEDDDDTQPIILHETRSVHCSEPIPIKSIVKFARPRGWFNQSDASPSEFFYQVLTSETGIRRIAYVLSTWEEDQELSIVKAVSVILISQNFHPKAFKELSLELSANMRNPDISLTSELVHFLTDELVEEGSTIEIRTKTLTIELVFNMSSSVPVTGKDVVMLFKMLGYCNVVKIVHALLSDCRIVLISSSLMRLSRCQNALLSLLYPFVYVHSCVTVLPSTLAEVLESPTPFLIGVLSDTETDCGEENIIVNLDNGEVRIPSNTEIHESDEFFMEKLHQRLRNVLFATTSQEDLAIPKDEEPNSEENLLDKKLRACFMLYFSELLYGYQFFILYTRIKGNFERRNPSSMTFHIGAFRGFRRLTDSMSANILKSVYFQTFLSTRALPRKYHDLFDEISCIKDLDQLVNRTRFANYEDGKIVDRIASDLVQKERFMDKCSTRSYETFTKLFINEKTEFSERSNSIIHTIKPRIKNTQLLNTMLPTVTAHIEFHANQSEIHAHRVEVLRNCLDSIFEKKSNNASKSLKACKMSMRFSPIRIELCRILNQKASYSVLSDRQFEDISMLINAALQVETDEDENGVVRSLMYISNVFSRRLSQGVQQYMYTTIQNHKIWKSALFWTSCFYYEVHETLFSEMLKRDRKLIDSLWCHTVRPCAMEMISLDDTDQEHLVIMENEIIQAEAKHFANLMICLHIPLTEEFFEVAENINTVQQEKMKWIVWTLDRIMSVTGRMNTISQPHVQTFVEAHVETLRDVYLEVTPAENMAKKKSCDPCLIRTGEYLICDPIRCFLIPPPYDSDTSCMLLERTLPAEGCLYLTNYRVIFKGVSMDINVLNNTVVQTFPMYSIESFKKITSRKLIPKEMKGFKIEHIISIRSHSSPSITVAFDDEEVNNITIEKFLETMESHQNHSFAFTNVRHDNNLDTFSQKSGTLNALKKLEGLARKKPSSDTRRFRNHSTHRGSLNVTFDKLDEYAHLKNNTHLRYVIVDYPRTGLNGKKVKLRMSSANSDYSLCPTYPAMFIVPSETSETELSKVAKGFADHRLPVVVWMNETGALLIRGSSFNSPDMVKKLKKVVNYRRNLPKLSTMMNGGSQQTLTSKTSSNEDGASNVVNGAEIRSAEVQLNYFAKLSNASPMTLEHCGDPEYYNFSKDFDRNLTITSKHANNFYFDRKALYILIEKGHQIKVPMDANAEVIVVKTVKEVDLRRSFQKVKQIQSKDYLTENKMSFIEAWRLSNWPQSLARMIELSNTVVALMSLYNSSVAICLESGRNVTTIISSLVQVLSDPYYRTIDGFQTLVEKEWLAFGHTFHNEADGCSPSIICFFDCMHQIMNQFPRAFEYTDFYLSYLAFHTTSGFFQTFIDDCEDKRFQTDASEYFPPDDLSQTNIWENIKLKRRNTDVFTNEGYELHSRDIIVPSFSLAQLSLWNFFTETHIRFGSPYDIESSEMEKVASGDDTIESIYEYDTFNESQSVFKSKQHFHTGAKENRIKKEEAADKFIKTLQQGYVKDLIESSLEKKGSQHSDAHTTAKEVKHELFPYATSIKAVQCCICANIVTRWSNAVHCKKCHVYLHVGCIQKEATIHGIAHFFHHKQTEELKMPPAAIEINTKNDTKENSFTTLERESVSPTQIPRIPPLSTGYLSKRGAKLKLWVPRFFVLYADVPKIFYYEDFEQWKTSEKPSGAIDLTDFTGFRMETNGRRGILELVMRNKTYRLLAENVNEATRWKECIEQVIRD